MADKVETPKEEIKEAIRLLHYAGNIKMDREARINYIRRVEENLQALLDSNFLDAPSAYNYI